MIFDFRPNFDSPNDDSGSRLIYIWLLVDDFRSRFNLWLVTRGQELILIERWFARLWGFNNWFWRLFLMCLWRFVHEEVFPWRFFIVSIFRDSHCEEFLFSEILLGSFFLKFFLWGCSIVKIFSMLILRLKIVLVCSYWGLKSLCWLFDTVSLAQGQISKWILTQGWSLEFWLTQGQIWNLKWFFNFGCLFGLAFCTIELILSFLNVFLKFWIWWLLCDHEYDWVCLLGAVVLLSWIDSNLNV